MAENEQNEDAIAVQEVAKASNKALGIVQQAGQFIGKFIEGPLNQVSGILDDTLRHRRARNLIRLENKLRDECAASGLDIDPRSLPLNFMVPLLQEATLESNDDLLDLWVRLIANAADPKSKVSPRRSHVSVLKEMTPFDARIFEAIYSVSPDDGKRKAIVTHELPERATNAASRIGEEKPPTPNHDVIASLANLQRIGVISYGSSWGGGEAYDYVNQNVFGYDLYQALKRRVSSR